MRALTDKNGHVLAELHWDGEITVHGNSAEKLARMAFNLIDSNQEESELLHSELIALRTKLKDTEEDLKRLDGAYEQVSSRMKNIVRTNHRLTKLLRLALPADSQVGSGLEGMVQSLIALACREQAYAAAQAELGVEE